MSVQSPKANEIQRRFVESDSPERKPTLKAHIFQTEKLAEAASSSGTGGESSARQRNGWQKARTTKTIAKLHTAGTAKFEAEQDRVVSSKSAPMERTAGLLVEPSHPSEAEAKRYNSKDLMNRRKVYSLTRKKLKGDEDNPANLQRSRRNSFQDISRTIADNVKKVTTLNQVSDALWDVACTRKVERQLSKVVRRVVDESDFVKVLNEFKQLVDLISALEKEHEITLPQLRRRVEDLLAEVTKLDSVMKEVQQKTEDLEGMVASKQFSSQDVEDAKGVLGGLVDECSDRMAEFRQHLLELGKPQRQVSKRQPIDNEDSLVKGVVDLLWTLPTEDRDPFEILLLQKDAVTEEDVENRSELWQAVEMQFLKLEQEDYEALQFDKIELVQNRIIEACQRRAWEERVNFVGHQSMEEQLRCMDNLIKQMEAHLEAPPEPTPDPTPEPLQISVPPDPTPEPLQISVPLERTVRIETQQQQQKEEEEEEIEKEESEEEEDSLDIQVQPPITRRISIPAAAPPPPPAPPRTRSDSWARVLPLMKNQPPAFTRSTTCPVAPKPVPQPTDGHRSWLLDVPDALDDAESALSSRSQSPEPEVPELPPEEMPPKEDDMPAAEPEDDVKSQASSAISFLSAGSLRQVSRDNMQSRWQTLQQQRQRVCGRTMLWLRQSNLTHTRHLHGCVGSRNETRMPDCSTTLAKEAEDPTRLTSQRSPSIAIASHDLVSPRNGAIMRTHWVSPFGLKREPPPKQAMQWLPRMEPLGFVFPSPARDPTKKILRPWDFVT